MRHALSITLIAFVLAAGCKKNEKAVVTSPGPGTAVVASQPTPEELGKMGAEIKKEPSKAHEILAAHGMDEKSFETAIRRVTEDPAASKRYAAAFKKTT